MINHNDLIAGFNPVQQGFAMTRSAKKNGISPDRQMSNSAALGVR
ncbi:MAG TPA: hypothetical protein VMU99_00125 [Acidimicrobiales bacterium]|nr:hypothetical protein [Acidimicrobiales bacterium]